MKIEKKRKKNCYKKEVRTFFFFFLLFTFENDRNLFWVYQKWEFSTGKEHFTPGKKKSGKMTLPPQKNMPVTPLVHTSPVEDLLKVFHTGSINFKQNSPLYTSI